jgi:hypothetical protein
MGEREDKKGISRIQTSEENPGKRLLRKYE